MSLHVAVDFGTSSTCVAVSVSGREPQVVVVDGQPLLPSAVFAAADGTLFVGQEAERQAAVDPARYEPHPKRRIDEGELLLGTTVLAVVDVVRAVLGRAVAEARRVAGGEPVDLLVLTHPADWGVIRTRVLRQAGRDLARELVLLPEPVAAAVFHSASHALPDGAALAVLDLGGGTVDASVVRRRAGGFEVLGTRGDPAFGGADIDHALLEHLGAMVSGPDPDAWRQLVAGHEIADRRRRRVLNLDVRGAKETLSRHAYADVPLPSPFPDAHVTRGDLEALVAGPLARTAELLVATVRDAGLTPGELAGIFLVGGSSRIPLVARLVRERTGVLPTTLDQPETVVARGALRAVAAVPGRPPAPAMPQAAGRPVHPSAPRTGGATVLPASAPAPAARRAGRRARVGWAVLGAAVVLVAAVAAVAAGGATFWATRPAGTLSPRTGGAATPSAASRPVAQYDYQFTVPGDWAQTGADASTRKVQLRPPGGSADGDLIAVEEHLLDYDSTADRGRAVEQLRQQFEQAGPAFSGFEPGAVYAGRNVVHYRQQVSGAAVDWYVVLQGGVQVNVGCQYTTSGRDQVLAACEQIVRTLRVSG